MSDSARIIMTFKCDKACPGCANTYGSVMGKAQPLYNIQQLMGYKNLVISGGEPMLYPERTLKLAKVLKKWVPGAKIFLYTAYYRNAGDIEKILPYIDGVNYTVHKEANDRDLKEFEEFQRAIRAFPGKNFRLYVDDAIKDKVHIDHNAWDRVKVAPWMTEPEMMASGGCPEDLFYLGKPEKKHNVPPPNPRPPGQTFNAKKPLSERIHYCERCNTFRLSEGILSSDWEDDVKKRQEEFDNADNEVKMSDSDFLKKWWQKSIPEIEQMIPAIEASKQRNNVLYRTAKRSMFAQIYRRFGENADDKIEYLKKILKSKLQNPDFVPDHFKLEETKSPHFSDIVKILTTVRMLNSGKTIDQVAASAKVSPAQIRGWMKQGGFRKLSSGKWVVGESSDDLFSQKPPADPNIENTRILKTQLANEQEYLKNDRDRYLECLNGKPLKDRKTPQEIRDGLILYWHVYRPIIDKEA